MRCTLHIICPDSFTFTNVNPNSYVGSQSVERFIEHQAFSPSNDMARSSLSPVIKFSLVKLTVLTEKWGEGGAKSYFGEKAWSSVNHPILSGRNPAQEI